MDLDVDVMEKAGYGLYCCCAAVVTAIMAAAQVAEIVLGYGLYYCFAAAVIIITSSEIIVAANHKILVVRNAQKAVDIHSFFISKS